MKRVIKCASKTEAEKVHNMIDFLIKEGVPEYEIIDYIYDQVTLEQFEKFMKYIAEKTGIDLQEYYDSLE